MWCIMGHLYLAQLVLYVSNPFSTMPVDLPSNALASPPPLPSGRNLAFLHFGVVGSFILRSWRTNVINHMLLPISYPCLVSPPTTTTHGQKPLSTFLWSGLLLGNMYLHTLVLPCGVYYLPHYQNLDPQWRSLPASLSESGSPEEFSRPAYYYIDSHNDIWLFNYTCYIYIANCLLLFVFCLFLSCAVLFQSY